MRNWVAKLSKGKLNHVLEGSSLRAPGGGSKVVFQKLRDGFKGALLKCIDDGERVATPEQCQSTMNKMLHEVYPTGMDDPEVQASLKRLVRHYGETPLCVKRKAHLWARDSTQTLTYSTTWRNHCFKGHRTESVVGPAHDTQGPCAKKGPVDREGVIWQGFVNVCQHRLTLHLIPPARVSDVDEVCAYFGIDPNIGRLNRGLAPIGVTPTAQHQHDRRTFTWCPMYCADGTSVDPICLPSERDAGNEPFRFKARAKAKAKAKAGGKAKAKSQS